MEKQDKQTPCNDYSVSYIAEKPKLDFDRERMRFAAATAAMQGLIANGYQWETEDIAKQAVKYADALIEELRKPRNESK